MSNILITGATAFIGSVSPAETISPKAQSLSIFLRLMLYLF